MRYIGTIHSRRGIKTVQRGKGMLTQLAVEELGSRNSRPGRNSLSRSSRLQRKRGAEMVAWGEHEQQ